MQIILCLPGNVFSGRFLECLAELVTYCFQNGISLKLSRKYSCNIYYARNLCLGADITRGSGQKPFDGKVDYDYLMWIDSDIIFTPIQFQRLLNQQKDVVAGLYRMEGGQCFAAVQDWDEEHFLKHGYFKFLTPQDLSAQKGLIEVAYSGMGFMLVKKGVFEVLEYPWFRPIEKKIGHMVDFTMEDVSFCLKAKEAGFQVLVDSAVIMGHEKKVVL